MITEEGLVPMDWCFNCACRAYEEDDYVGKMFAYIFIDFARKDMDLRKGLILNQKCGYAEDGEYIHHYEFKIPGEVIKRFSQLECIGDYATARPVALYNFLQPIIEEAVDGQLVDYQIARTTDCSLIIKVKTGAEL